MTAAGARVGVLGLGQIGGALVERLAKTGPAPWVHDVEPAALARAVAAGARSRASASALAATTDVVLVAVRDDAQCIAGVRQLLDGAEPGTVVAVLSTVMPVTIHQLAAHAAEHGVHLVDAPVTGKGRETMEAGEMHVLAGGPDDVLERLRPVVQRFGHLLPVGPVGSAAVLKLAHNVMVYGGYAAAIEAVELARAAGVWDGLVEEVTRVSGTLSPQQELFLAIYERRRRGEVDDVEDEIMQISAAILDKDLDDALAVAENHGVRLPVAERLAGMGDDVYLVDPHAAANGDHPWSTSR
jgi:3-hydroxyisobutyrate dehydrogenase-like beta-hydroxyacid dehydrogenase